MNNLSNYEKFLEILSQDLEMMFEHQKDYICCREGCSFCCENGEYPFTEIEFEFLMQGFNNIDNKLQQKIKDNISKISLDKKGFYTCPFLINKKCAVYKNRGIVCRTFGLISKDVNGHVDGPFCGKLGLNYADVYDKETKKLRMDIVESKGYKNLPRIFSLDISNIRKLDLVKELNIEFSPQKSLIEWLKNKF